MLSTMSDSNPYAAPSAPLSAPQISSRGTFVPNGKVVDAGRGLEWVKIGFRSFFAAPLAWFFGPLVMMFAVFVLACIPIVNFVVGVVTPLLHAGYYAAGEAQARQQKLDIGDFFRGARDKAGELLILGLVVAIANAIAFGAFFVIAGAGAVTTLLTIQGPPDLTSINWIPMLLGALLYMVCLVPIAMAFWFAPALVLFANLQPLEALKQSFNACTKNVMPYLVYGLVGAGLMLGGVLTLFLGFFLIYPALLASLYPQYVDIFES